MFSILKKEFSAFLSSLTGYMVIGVFLLLTGLFMWFFPDYSVLEYSFATMDQFFDFAPLILLFLIPAITMRSFAEERQSGTIELLMTKPLREMDIIFGKFLAAFALVVVALIPTLIYYFSISFLGSPPGNIDSGATFGSYFGLLMLGSVFTAIGLFASVLTNNQIIAFISAMFLSFLMYFAFNFISKLPVFFGKSDIFVLMLGLEYHYDNLSRGALDTRDILYFLSVTTFFLLLTRYKLKDL